MVCYYPLLFLNVKFMADPGEGERQGQSIDQSGKTDYPKKLTTADDELWQILEETMSELQVFRGRMLCFLEEVWGKGVRSVREFRKFSCVHTSFYR